MLRLFACLLLLCFVSSTYSQSCAQDIFSNVTVTKYSGDPSDPLTIKVRSSDDVRDSYHIEVINQKIPILCSGSVKDFSDLDKLILRLDGINSIEPGAFQNVPVLRDLQITHNKIKTIHKGVFNHLSVKFLDLKSNQISTIEPDAFDNMPRLNVLELDFNEIAEISPAWFTGSPRVRRLTMAENKLTTIPASAFKNIGNNKLDVWLQANQITTIDPNAFEGVAQANYLWLQDNKIEEVNDKLFADVREMEHLSLGGNKMRCFSDAFLENLHAKSVNFDSNPLDCTCLGKLKTWARKNNVESRLLVSRLQCVAEHARQVLEESRNS